MIRHGGFTRYLLIALWLAFVSRPSMVSASFSTWQTAKPLTLGQPAKHQINLTDENQYYTFTLPAATRGKVSLKFSQETPSQPPPPDRYAWEVTLITLLNGTEAPPLLTAGISLRETNFTSPPVHLEAGTYYLLVKGIGGEAIGTGYTLSVSPEVEVTMNGEGSVNSVPSGIACTVGTCSGFFPGEVKVELRAVGGSWYSSFDRWSGDCSGTGICELIPDTIRKVEAIFKANQNVELLCSVRKNNYSRIADAYNVATSGCTIRSRCITFEEYLVFNKQITVVIDGGKDTFFDKYIGYTTIKGSFKLRNGRVNVNRLIVR